MGAPGTTTRPPHRIPFWGEWDCWTTAALRGTGFPFAWLLRLAREEAAAAVPAVL